MDSICSICINECSLCFLFSSSSFSLFGRSNLVITNFIHTDTLSPAAGWMDGQTVWYDVEKGRFLVGDYMAKPHVIPVSIYVQFFMSYCVFCYFSAALDIFFNRSIRKTAWSYVQCTIFILSLDLIHWLVSWTFAPAPGLGHSFSSYRVSSLSPLPFFITGICRP